MAVSVQRADAGADAGGAGAGEREGRLRLCAHGVRQNRRLPHSDHCPTPCTGEGTCQGFLIVFSDAVRE